jgi:GNAT superfamily N-acetyltransferase
MIRFERASKIEHLDQILDLQKQNLKQNLSLEQQTSQGFVTAQHTFEELKKINDAENAMIVTDDSGVVAYAIAMQAKLGYDMPVFNDLFAELDKIEICGKPLKSYSFIIVGQLCVHQHYRGIGLVPKLYSYYKDQLKSKYQLAITDISSLNVRSLRAHQNSGFRKVHTFYDQFTATDWDIVVMDLSDNLINAE